VVAELFDQAIAASSLNRAGAVQLDLERQAAADLGQAEPAFALEPILGELVEARVARQRHARVLRAILVTAYNEARVHGTKGVRVYLEQPGEWLRLRVGNLPRPDSQGTSGEGGPRISGLVAKLPDGALTEPPRLRSATELGFPGDGDWWLVEVTFSPSILVHTVKSPTR
jgi:hypothetical protein